MTRWTEYVTTWNDVQRLSEVLTVPTTIQGLSYWTVSEIADELGVSRQTLWRWRKADEIPQGCKARGNRVVFSRDEVAAIRAFAERVEPIAPPEDEMQPSLFHAESSR